MKIIVEQAHAGQSSEQTQFQAPIQNHRFDMDGRKNPALTNHKIQSIEQTHNCAAIQAFPAATPCLECFMPQKTLPFLHSGALLITVRRPPGPLAVALRFLLAALMAVALPAHGTRQLPAPIDESARIAIEQFLMQQSAGLPGKVGITIDLPQSGALPPCDALEPFLPSQARLWGRVSVGVRCISGQPWTRYVQAYIAVTGSYQVAAQAISRGQALTSADIVLREGDLTTLPASVVADPSQLIGMTALNGIASGAPVRRDLLRREMVVRQGQNIKVVSRGAGFAVSAEGKVMTDASLGGVVQVKMQGGHLISGVVRLEGIVERSN